MIKILKQIFIKLPCVYPDNIFFLSTVQKFCCCYGLYLENTLDIIRASSLLKFRMDIPLDAWCFRYGVKILIRCIVTTSCTTYLQAHSVRVRYWLHASQLCRGLLIKHVSIIFMNLIHTVYFQMLYM